MSNSTKVPRRNAGGQVGSTTSGHVSIYDVGGIKLESPGRVRAGRPGGGGKRGKVAKWTSHSRARLQRSLQTLSAPVGWYTIGATFTIPGPPLPVEQCQKLWADFSLFVFKRKLGMIWRVEVQQRGALHWHALCVGGPGEYPLFYEGRRLPVKPELIPEWSESGVEKLGWLFRWYWHDALRKLGPFVYDPPYRGGKGTWKIGITDVNHLMSLPGADERSFHFSGAGMGDDDAKRGVPHAGDGAWLRYLQDHTSKSKQEQSGENIGRHWGVVGRAFFSQVTAREQIALSRWDYARIRRTLARWSRPRIRDERCMFGWRHGWQTSKGTGAGTSRWFMPAHLAERVIVWVRSLPPSERERVARREQEVQRLLRVLRRRAEDLVRVRLVNGRVVAPFVQPEWFGDSHGRVT